MESSDLDVQAAFPREACRSARELHIVEHYASRFEFNVRAAASIAQRWELTVVASSTKTGYGRLPEVTNGRFVAAKLEKPALCIGQLWRSPKVGYGSEHD
jgi:hypothetical protein